MLRDPRLIGEEYGLASTSDEERENEPVGPPSSLFKATLTFPARDPFASDNASSDAFPGTTPNAASGALRGTFASGHESPLLEASAWDDGWEELPVAAKAERSTMPASKEEHVAGSTMLELSSSLLESDRDTALAYASLHGSLVPTPPPADLAAMDERWEESDTVRPPAASERTPGGIAVPPAALLHAPAPELVAELALVAERARKAEAALAVAQATNAAHEATDTAREAERTQAVHAELLRTTTAPPRRRRSLLRRILVPVIISNVAVAVAVGVLARVTVRKPAVVHTARVGEIGRSPLAPDEPLDVPAPVQSCATAGASRVLATRAQIGPGLDVSPLDSGFAVGLASGTMETVALRLEGSGLRVAERVRSHASGVVQRLTVDPLDEDGLDVRVDSEEARTIVGTPPFRIIARNGAISAWRDAAPRVLWTLPPRTDVRAPVLVPAPTPRRPAFLARIESERTNFDRKARSGKDPKPEGTRPIFVSPAPVESVRAAGLRDGGAVVVVRRSSLLLVGLVDPSLRADGGLVQIARKSPVSMPAVAPAGTGGVAVWSEKLGTGSVVMAALITPDGEGSRIAALEAVGKGTSPSVTELPDGDLLFAFTESTAGGHRVVAARFAHDLSPRGEPIVVSPVASDAVQPVAAVRPDGSAIIAFFTSERGHSAVVATPLACD